MLFDSCDGSYAVGEGSNSDSVFKDHIDSFYLGLSLGSFYNVRISNKVCIFVGHDVSRLRSLYEFYYGLRPAVSSVDSLNGRYFEDVVDMFPSFFNMTAVVRAVSVKGSLEGSVKNLSLQTYTDLRKYFLY